MTNQDSSKDRQGGLETPTVAQKAQLSQVVDYSEFLKELAAQRHTVVDSYLRISTSYAGYRVVQERAEGLIKGIDELINATLRHIEVNDLQLQGLDGNTKVNSEVQL